MTENSKIAICMATYNGEAYVAEQIKSIIAQTYKNWILYIRDDGSSDNTVEIIKGFAREYPDKIILLEKVGGINISLLFACMMICNLATSVIF